VVQFAVANGNSPSVGKLVDMAMMVLTAGKERTVPEYRGLLAGAGLRLNRVVPVPGDFEVIEAMLV
jgi:hypothetical protein